MKATRTTIAVLTAAALIVTWAIPVSAKRPVTETVKVTMTLVDANDDGVTGGLTTDCDDGDGDNGYLLMTRDRKGLVGGESAVILGLYMNDVEWGRRYPSLSSGIGFAGCRGDTVDGSPVENVMYGGLGINIDRGGAVTDVLWHFDYYLDGTEVQINPRKTRFEWTTREYYTLIGNDLEWDPETSTVSGWFHLAHSLYDTETEFGYQEFAGSPRWMEFTLTIESNA